MRQQGKKAEMAKRRSQVAELYIQGWPQARIALQLGVTQPTVGNDLKAIQAQWRVSALRDFDAARELELQKLDRIERESWEAWERSQQPAQSGKVRLLASGGETTEKSLEHQTGDPRYLDQVLKCIDARSKLLGLFAPTKIAPVTPDGREPFRLAVANMSLDELRALKNLQAKVLTSDVDHSEIIDDQTDRHTAADPTD